MRGRYQDVLPNSQLASLDIQKEIIGLLNLQHESQAVIGPKAAAAFEATGTNTTQFSIDFVIQPYSYSLGNCCYLFSSIVIGHFYFFYECYFLLFRSFSGPQLREMHDVCLVQTRRVYCKLALPACSRLVRCLAALPQSLKNINCLSPLLVHRFCCAGVGVFFWPISETKGTMPTMIL